MSLHAKYIAHSEICIHNLACVDVTKHHPDCVWHSKADKIVKTNFACSIPILHAQITIFACSKQFLHAQNKKVLHAQF